ncbi:hypothetical protein B9Y64_13420 [Stenotrophomonas maltophilia]|uniref:Uncharacterized protein n=1 Tax=Stenotrophomonas maltophilia TaxID=40324 RepID=A0A2J0UB00_STEMA|nr:hypothetical protein B9Y64_13420 [Stenotrophomonas maltophilia]
MKWLGATILEQGGNFPIDEPSPDCFIVITIVCITILINQLDSRSACKVPPKIFINIGLEEYEA